MTGEEHYRETERLLAGEHREGDSARPEGWHTPPTAEAIAMAQVHATLALAAAQSWIPASNGYPDRERYGVDTR
jgi:hypothetical protein